MAMAEIAVAAVSGAFSVFAALAAHRAHRQVRSPNGKPTGELVARIDERLDRLDERLYEHVTNTAVHADWRRRDGL